MLKRHYVCTHAEDKEAFGFFSSAKKEPLLAIDTPSMRQSLILEGLSFPHTKQWPTYILRHFFTTGSRTVGIRTTRLRCHLLFLDELEASAHDAVVGIVVGRPFGAAAVAVGRGRVCRWLVLARRNIFDITFWKSEQSAVFSDQWFQSCFKKIYVEDSHYCLVCYVKENLLYFLNALNLD